MTDGKSRSWHEKKDLGERYVQCLLAEAGQDVGFDAWVKKMVADGPEPVTHAYADAPTVPVITATTSTATILITTAPSPTAVSATTLSAIVAALTNTAISTIASTHPRPLWNLQVSSSRLATQPTAEEGAG